MPSPFPGMDPYLEDPAFWSGFHTRFIVAIGAALTGRLPSGYYADVEQHVWLEDEEGDDRRPFAVPDSYVADAGGGGTAVAVAAMTKASAEITFPKLRKRPHKYVAVVDQPGNRVVTVIEVLSPANKSGDDRDAYLLKRAEYFAAKVTVVELDLLRDGERLPMGRPRPAPADYCAVVCRANRYPKASVWGWTVRDPLPVLPIPLKPADGDIALEVRPCLDRAYEDAGYHTRIRYDRPPEFPLRAADAEWAAGLFAKPKKSRKGG